MAKKESVLEGLASLNEHETIQQVQYANPWALAANNAEAEIVRLKDKVKALRSSIRMFRKAEAAGIEFPVN